MAHETLSPTEFSSAVTAITSAFGDPTRRQIYLFTHENPEGVTAGEVAERFSLHPNVARHHLDKLAASGHLSVSTAKPPTASGTGAGRPSKFYRPVEEAVALDVAIRHDDLLVTLLGRALALLDPNDAEALALEVGEDYGRAMAASFQDANESQRSFRSALHAVADALSAHGFDAHTEEVGNELRIITEHCPFGDTASRHPVICAVDRGMVRGMLSELYGETVTITEATRATGSPNCITTVSG